jgi:chemotaxis family two-component system response regulator Rcp1
MVLDGFRSADLALELTNRPRTLSKCTSRLAAVKHRMDIFVASTR